MRNWQKDMKLCEQATPGPWEVTIKWNADYCLVKGRDWDVAQVIYDDDRRSWKNKYELAFAEGDAQFIAEARQALPHWLTAYRELVKSIEKMTPGGSEFHDDPERCLQWIRDRLDSVVEQTKKRKKAEAVVEVAKDTCEELMGHGLIAIATLQKALDDMGEEGNGGPLRV